MCAHNIINRNGISNLEANILATFAGQGKNIFTFDEIKTEFNLDNESIWQIIYNLLQKRWIERLSRGKYIIIPLEAGIEGVTTEHEFNIASHIVKPYAVGYWSALNYHGFTEQIPAWTYVLTTKRVKKRELTILNNRFRIVTLRPYKFFGNGKVWINEKHITITDKEKTILDCLDLPQYAGGLDLVSAAINEYSREIDFKKINEYVNKLKNQTIVKRLGFLCEYYGIKNTHLNKWRKLITAGYGKLDPTKERRGKYNNRWGLIINAGLG